MTHKKKEPRKGRALERLEAHLKRRYGKNQQWHCTECNVRNVGDHCQNCGRTSWGRPDHVVTPNDEKEARAGLREDVSQGFTSYEP